MNNKIRDYLNERSKDNRSYYAIDGVIRLSLNKRLIDKSEGRIKRFFNNY